MVKNRLQWWAEQNNLLPLSQHGFRKGHSCVGNLTHITLKIEEAFLEKKEVLAAYLDIRGAFDNVNADILSHRLASMGCSINLIYFVKFLTQERRIFTDNSELKITNKDVPQGGVLSPLLYLLYVANVTDNFPKSVTVSQFADDIAVYIKFNSMKRGNCQKRLKQLKVTLTF